ncbi:M20 metallopeptidase family protein [Zunongwangia atlantica]|uniref:Metal-dependent amidase/aminoacylase/carboxypeptidase n=1 Tax=Zunongwangia atlantica 22II14-10F7 TaxID=1185767 RepID=A0A1Y1T6D2_9FLAO|nr:amidohydrolase [Zunongwangia atlantica]ORL46598.1 metal-dependent amidase/aminoacylase/carboxypeptidase [Zunongwangia atlantica 22II14-10F7]
MTFTRSFRLLFIWPLILISTLVIGQEQQQEANIHQIIQQHSAEIFDSLVEIRRNFHRNPEAAGEEVKTSAKIIEYLQNLGLEVHQNIGGNGVVGILKTNKKGKKIAWRADIDALKTDLPDVVSYESKNKGVRHICGHDIHASVALGIANVLSKIKDQLSGTIYFIFQPAEENWQGAKAMIDDGLFEIIDPEEIYALHLSPMPEGIIATRAKNLFADYKVIQLKFDKKEDASELTNYVKNLLENLQNVTNDSPFWDMQTLMDPELGLINPNTIFKDYVTLNSEVFINENEENLIVKVALSASDPDKLNSLLKQLKSEISHSEFSEKLIEIQFTEEIALVLNDKKLTEDAIQQISEVYGKQSSINLHGIIPDGRSDDFAYFQQKIPGVYFLMGGSNYQKGIISMPHSPNFNVDENCIKTGVQYFSSLIAEKLK